MAHGKKTGGRKKGARNKASIERALAVAKAGITPKDFMLEVMAGRLIPRTVTGEARFNVRLDAAKAVAPYAHPRLQAVLQQNLPPPGQDAPALSATELARLMLFVLHDARR